MQYICDPSEVSLAAHGKARNRVVEFESFEEVCQNIYSHLCECRCEYGVPEFRGLDVCSRVGVGAFAS